MRNLLVFLFFIPNLLIAKVPRGIKAKTKPPIVVKNDIPIVLDLSKPIYETQIDRSGRAISELIRHKDSNGLATGSVFKKSVNLSAARFKNDCDLRLSSFNSDCNFAQTKFDASCDFTMCKFRSYCDFSQTKIKSECEFRGSEFDTTFDFSMAHLYSTLVISQAHFHFQSYFVGTIFDHNADFGQVHCDSLSSFSSARFISESNFRDARFSSPCSFLAVRFGLHSVFSAAQFHSTITFSKAQFQSTSEFDHAQFDSTAEFNDAQFHDKVNFSNMKFHSKADFSDTHFDSTTNFSYAIFEGNALFTSTRFNRKMALVMHYLQVTNNTVFNFSHALLPDTVDLSHNIFLGLTANIDFTLADSLKAREVKHEMSFWQYLWHPIKNYYWYPFDTTGDSQKIKINLYNTDVSKIKIDYNHFKFYVYDDENKDTLSKEIKESIYEGLLKNFKERGQTDSYEKMDIEYRRFKDEIKPDKFSLQDWWWRYGYDRNRIFKHAILFILIFSILNFFFLDRFNKKDEGIYRVEFFPEFQPYHFGLRLRRTSQFLKRFWFSFIYTAIIFFLLTLKIENLRFYRAGHSWGRLAATVWIMVIYAVGLICMGFMANLVLQK